MGRSWPGRVTDDNGPERTLGPQPGLAEMREEEGEGGMET